MEERQLDHLMKAAQADEIYQDMVVLQKYYEAQFQRILITLPEADQINLKMYVRVCEGLEDRIIRTAYFLKPLEP